MVVDAVHSHFRTQILSNSQIHKSLKWSGLVALVKRRQLGGGVTVADPGAEMFRRHTASGQRKRHSESWLFRTVRSIRTQPVPHCCLCSEKSTDGRNNRGIDLFPPFLLKSFRFHEESFPL